MSSALLVLSSSPLYVKSSSPIQLPHSVNSKNLAIRHNVHPTLTRVRHDKRMYAHAGGKEDRHVPFRHYMVATVLAASLLVSSPSVLPAAAADSYSIDWQSLIKPSSPSSDSSSPPIQAPPHPSSETPVSPEERAQLLKLVLDQRQAEKEARLVAKAEARARPPVTAPAAPAVREQVAPAVTPVPAKAAVEAPKLAVKTRSHGFLPLFLSQFLLLGGVAGAIAALVKLPESKWTELTQTVDSAVEKASPSIVSAWEMSQPVAKEAFATTQRLATEAAPYVVKAAKAAKPLVLKAAEAAKPLVLKAVEAAKPLLQQGRQKVEDLIQSAREKGDESQTTTGTREVEEKGAVEKVTEKAKNGIESVGEGVKEEGESVRIETEAVSQRVGGGAQSDK